MATIDETILQACRTWLKAAGSRAGLTDAQVRVANTSGPRPDHAYLTVRITAGDIPVGVDEELNALADVLTVQNEAAAGTTYTATVNGTAVTYTRTAEDTTDDDVAEGLADAINTAVDTVYAEADGARVVVAPKVGELTTSTADPNLARVADDVAVVGIHGERRATVSVQGFGAEAAGWLERIALRLRTPAIIELLAELGLSVIPVGGMTDLASLIDTKAEPRYLREFELRYAVRGEPSSRTTAATVSIATTLERYADHPDAITDTLTADVHE